MRAYKIALQAEWAAAERAGVYTGAAIDLADGFIHLSTAEQTAETLAKHFAGQTSLILLAVDLTKVSGAVKWEVSRGGALFPHIYGNLPVSAVTDTRAIPDDPQARAAFSADLK